MPTSSAREMLLRATFLVAVAVLALNDHLLKSIFSNWLTGTLSDIAGLFGLTVFAAAFAPGLRIALEVFIAAAFVWWKSPAASRSSPPLAGNSVGGRALS
jgi:hypothetical protein